MGPRPTQRVAAQQQTHLQPIALIVLITRTIHELKHEAFYEAQLRRILKALCETLPKYEYSLGYLDRIERRSHLIAGVISDLADKRHIEKKSRKNEMWTFTSTFEAGAASLTQGNFTRDVEEDLTRRIKDICRTTFV